MENRSLKHLSGTFPTPQRLFVSLLCVIFLVLAWAMPAHAHDILAIAGSGGSISPSGWVTVADGDDQTFTISPNTGYVIGDVTVDGTSIGAVSSY